MVGEHSQAPGSADGFEAYRIAFPGLASIRIEPGERHEDEDVARAAQFPAELARRAHRIFGRRKQPDVATGVVLEPIDRPVAIGKQDLVIVTQVRDRAQVPCKFASVAFGSQVNRNETQPDEQAGTENHDTADRRARDRGLVGAGGGRERKRDRDR